MVSMRKIREVGRRIGREFHPDRVVLFGSHAEGDFLTARRESGARKRQQIIDRAACPILVVK